MKRNVRRAITYSISTVFILFFIYLISFVSEEKVEEITLAVGWLGPLFIALFIFLTQVFAPLTGNMGILVGIKLYGYGQTLILFYLACMTSAVVNFYLSRIYGRKLVIRMVGKDSMDQVDEIAAAEERKILIGSRVFGYFFFDLISYALGLTRVSFKRYFYFTAVLTLIPFLLQYFAFRSLDFQSFHGLLIYYLSLVATGFLFAQFFIRLYLKRRKAKKQEQEVVEEKEENVV